MNSITVEKFKHEELINVITHFPGILFGIVASIILTTKSSELVSASTTPFLVYGISFILLYIASTIYHNAKKSDVKQFLKKVDHAAIYVFMAGSYTPFVWTFMVDEYKKPFLTLVWIMATLGVVYKFLSKYRTRGISLTLYLSFGFMCLLTWNHMLAFIPKDSFLLLVAGGVAYVFGSIFYVFTNIPYHHGIWHLFCLLGSTLHFYAIFLIL